MQTQLPFFPSDTKLINASVGFREHGDTVYYFLCGSPIYCHAKDDRNGYRFSLANLIVNKLCTISELSIALGEGRKNIERYAKALRDHGASYFFVREDRRGQCYKMTPEKLSLIQGDLDRGSSIYRAALDHEISETAISYHIKNGNLKKKSHQRK
jgi:biotin operon repressor